MSDLERLHRLLRPSLAGRDLTDQETWEYLAGRRVGGISDGLSYQCEPRGVLLREHGEKRFVPWTSLAQPSIFDALEAQP